MSTREENSSSIPIELIISILSRLPAKSLARFRYLSKLWASIIHCPNFTKLFITKSSAQPRLLFALERASEWCFLTSPQPHNPYDKSSLVVTADFQMKCPGHISPECCVFASGLIYFHHMPRISKQDKDIVAQPMICNPSTRQYVSLPSGNMKKYWRSLLGFDPITKQAKVLSMNASLYDAKDREPPQVLTLGTKNVLWRNIHCPLTHFPTDEGVCINGVLYYLGFRFLEWSRMLVCFDVRSETFKFVDYEFFHNQRDTKLINYKSKLGGITWKLNNNFGEDPLRIKDSRELHMWVMNDVDKPDERLHYSYIFLEGKKVVNGFVSVAGVTATGEIVFSVDNPSKPFMFSTSILKGTLSKELKSKALNRLRI